LRTRFLPARAERFPSDATPFLKNRVPSETIPTIANPLPTKRLSFNAFPFRRGVASDLSFKIVPNLDTTFIGLTE